MRVGKTAVPGEVFHRAPVLEEDIQIGEGAKKSAEPGRLSPVSGGNHGRRHASAKNDLGQGIHAISILPQSGGRDSQLLAIKYMFTRLECIDHHTSVCIMTGSHHYKIYFRISYDYIIICSGLRNAIFFG